MPLFRHKTPESVPAYDPELFTPVIRSSICTGEKVAGFREKATGRFREVMLIRTQDDVETFRCRYGIHGTIETVY